MGRPAPTTGRTRRTRVFFKQGVLTPLPVLSHYKKRSWPDVSDLEGAQEAARYGMWCAVFVAGVSTLFLEQYSR
jgi:hypothetical protein